MTQKLILHKPLGFVDILSYVYIRITIVNEYCKQKIHHTHIHTHIKTQTIHAHCMGHAGLLVGWGMGGGWWG